MPYIQIKKNTDLKGLLISRGKGKCMLIKTAIARTVIRPSANHRRELDYTGTLWSDGEAWRLSSGRSGAVTTGTA